MQPSGAAGDAQTEGAAGVLLLSDVLVASLRQKGLDDTRTNCGSGACFPRHGRVHPFRMGDTDVAGILPTVGSFDWRTGTPTTIAQAVLRKLSRPVAPNTAPTPSPTGKPVAALPRGPRAATGRKAEVLREDRPSRRSTPAGRTCFLGRSFRAGSGPRSDEMSVRIAASLCLCVYGFFVGLR